MGSKRKQTAAYIEALISERGGYCKKTLLDLGVPWPPKKGWKARLISSSHKDAKLSKAGISPEKRQVCPKVNSKTFYSSWEWKKVRYEALQLHGARCMCCGWEPSPGNKGNICVDHIKPKSKFPKLALSISNLQILCNSCNMGKSNTHTDDFRSAWHGEDDQEAFWMDDAYSRTIQ